METTYKFIQMGQRIMRVGKWQLVLAYLKSVIKKDTEFQIMSVFTAEMVADLWLLGWVEDNKQGN